MGMSAKSRAILAAESKNEWNWFMKDLAQAKQDYATDVAAAEEEAGSRSGWQKLIGTIAFIAAAAYTFVSPEKMSGIAMLKASATAAGWGATAGTLASGGTAMAQKGLEGTYVGDRLGLDATTILGQTDIPPEYLEDVHQPKYGKGQAEYQTTEFETDMELGTANLDDWYDKAWETALYENIGRGSSFMSMLTPMGYKG